MRLEDFMLPCLNKSLLGVECMGCGIQRSAFLVVKGNFTDAFYMYPAIYTLILLFVILLISVIKKFKYSQKIIRSLAVVNVAIIIVSYLIKIT